MDIHESYKEFTNEETNYPSDLAIDDMVNFIPMFKHTEEYGISMEPMFGRIVAVRFSKAKVFYDIVDDYYSYMFKDVDSIKVSNKKFSESDIKKLTE